MTSDLRLCADHLSALSTFFSIAAASDKGIEMDAESVRNLADLFRVVNRLFDNLAQEIEVHRLAEAGRTGRAAVDQLATEAFGNLLIDAEQKVVRPDFGKGKRS